MSKILEELYVAKAMIEVNIKEDEVTKNELALYVDNINLELVNNLIERNEAMEITHHLASEVISLRMDIESFRHILNIALDLKFKPVKLTPTKIILRDECEFIIFERNSNFDYQWDRMDIRIGEVKELMALAVM